MNGSRVPALLALVSSTEMCAFGAWRQDAVRMPSPLMPPPEWQEPNEGACCLLWRLIDGLEGALAPLVQLQRAPLLTACLGAELVCVHNRASSSTAEHTSVCMTQPRVCCLRTKKMPTSLPSGLWLRLSPQLLVSFHTPSTLSAVA